jgi:LAO/AO transport system kinase
MSFAASGFKGQTASPALKNLVQAALEGHVPAIARLITMAENNSENALAVQKKVFPHSGKAHLVGITGPAGAGKSTLIAKLAAILAASGQKVAVVACDPSSPISGGALLGDRIRMHDLVVNKNVFIRSIATGSSVGGVPLAAFRAADILDACGFNTVIIETVGTGQNQVDIMQAAHTIIAVSAPGLGDDIQAMKSGLLEIADIHAITKNDLAGASKTLMDIANAVHMRQRSVKHDDVAEAWTPLVLSISGLSGEGVIELQQAIKAHYSFLQQADHMHSRCRQMFRQRIYSEAINILSKSLSEMPIERISESLEQIIKRELTPAQVAKKVLVLLK